MFLPLPVQPVAARQQPTQAPLPAVLLKSIDVYAVLGRTHAKAAEASSVLFKCNLSPLQVAGNLPKLLQRRFQVISDVFGQFVGFRQVLRVFQALILDPEDVQIQLVALGQVFVDEGTPAIELLSLS